MSKGLVLDFETADRITLVNMKDALNNIENQVKNHLEKGSYMHPDDLVEAKAYLIPAFKTLIKYYGG